MVPTLLLRGMIGLERAALVGLLSGLVAIAFRAVLTAGDNLRSSAVLLTDFVRGVGRGSLRQFVQIAVAIRLFCNHRTDVEFRCLLQ